MHCGLRTTGSVILQNCFKFLSFPFLPRRWYLLTFLRQSYFLLHLLAKASTDRFEIAAPPALQFSCGSCCQVVNMSVATHSNTAFSDEGEEAEGGTERR